MILGKLGSAFKNGIKRITNAILIDKRVVDAVVKDIQRALIEADVSIELVLEITNKIKKIGYSENIKGIDKKEQLVKLIHDELINILGKKKELKLGKRTKILFLGLYGAGKTTTIAKLGFYYAKRGRKVALLGLDTQRPAAMDQLEQMAEKANLKAFVDKEEKDPLKIIEKYEKELEKYDLVLVDSAGRDGLNEELIEEIKSIDERIRADYRILVMPADIGQAAKNQAHEFQKALSIDGVIITRMDGTSKAGGALTACNETNAPVFFIGVGEKLHDIEGFDPESFVQRLLGMGDLNALLEKIKTLTSEKEQKALEEKLKEGKFTLLDLYEQLEQMNKMGSMDKLLSFVPGFSGKIPKEALSKQEDKMKKFLAAIKSMTWEEIENPALLEKQTSRIQRVARGSGTTTGNVRELLKQYRLMNDMIKMQTDVSGGIDKRLLQKMAKRFKGKIRF